MNRRAFLGGLALSAITRRLLSDPLSDAPILAPKRLVIIQQNNGTQQSNFWPNQNFNSPILDPILSNPRLAARTTIVKGVYVPRDANGTDANEHDMGFARMWTGEKLLSRGGHPWGGGASVDQLVASALKSESMTLAVWASSVQPFPKPGFNHRRSFSYSAPGVHRLPLIDPFEVYTRWFASPDEVDEATKRKLLLRKSALDVAAKDLSSMRSRLGSTERIKLDAHASSIRDAENRLSDMIAGRAGPGATSWLKPFPPREYRNSRPDLLVSDESAVPDIVYSFVDLIAAGIASNATSVATLQLGYGGGQWRFDWEGVGHDHHDLAHQDKTDEGVDPAVTQKIVTLNRWYAKQIARLASKLDEIPEMGGTVLDHTLLVWANEFGRGDHNQENVPVVFVGGKLGHGKLVDVGRQPFQRVGTSVLNAMGIPAEGFGDLPDCGMLQGV